MSEKEKPIKADTRDIIKVDTSKEYIGLYGPNKMSLIAQKLLYIAIAQTKKGDDCFGLYFISVSELAKLTGRNQKRLKMDAGKIVKESLQTFVYDEKNHIPKGYPVYAELYYENEMFVFQLNERMARYLLNLKEFVKTVLSDILPMEYKHSISIYRLMQLRNKDSNIRRTSVYISLDDIIKATATNYAHKDIRSHVLKPALRDISLYCMCDANIRNIYIPGTHTIQGYQITTSS